MIELDAQNLRIKQTSSYVEELLKQANNILRKEFDEKNHGASLPNLAQMLTAVGIDVNTDINVQNSLRQVAYHRGDYAHRGVNSRVTNVPDNVAISRYYQDCLTLCEEIYNNARKKI